MADPEATARAALAAYGLDDARVTVRRWRVNGVCRVDASQGTFALRVHRPGYRSPAQTRSAASSDQPPENTDTRQNSAFSALLSRS